jgi:hypothetical protein
MEECKLVDLCDIFDKGRYLKTEDEEMMRSQYCRADYTSCARYLILLALGIENCPKDLLPDQIARIEKILKLT